MITDKKGFTLIEMLLVLLLMGLVISSASSVFVSVYSQSRSQGRITESYESLIGLNMLMVDLNQAGYGLPWANLVNYTEEGGNLFGLNDAPNNAPRAVLSRDGAVYAAPDDIFNGSDYLVIKSMSVARNDTSQKWTYVRQGNVMREWNPARESLATGDRVVLLKPMADGTRPLVQSGGLFYTTYQNNASPTPDALADPGFAPVDENEVYLVYGIGTGNPARPFNRADYYIRRPATMPGRCAPNTGILYKATMNHDVAGSLDEQPLIDCVADMQVIYGLDLDEDGDFQPGVAGSTDGYSSNITMLTAEELRKRIKEVRVYILAHEGQFDRNFTYANPTITVGEFGLGQDFNLGTNRNYRWKVYQLQVRPLNLTYIGG